MANIFSSGSHALILNALTRIMGAAPLVDPYHYPGDQGGGWGQPGPSWSTTARSESSIYVFADCITVTTTVANAFTSAVSSSRIVITGLGPACQPTFSAISPTAATSISILITYRVADFNRHQLCRLLLEGTYGYHMQTSRCFYVQLAGGLHYNAIAHIHRDISQPNHIIGLCYSDLDVSRGILSFRNGSYNNRYDPNTDPSPVIHYHCNDQNFTDSRW